MIPLAAEVKEWLQKSIWLTNNKLILLIDLLFMRLNQHGDLLFI